MRALRLSKMSEKLIAYLFNHVSMTEVYSVLQMICKIVSIGI